MNRLEGNGAARLVSLMRQHGFNKELDVELATVVSITPLKLRLDNANFDLEADDFVLSEHLTQHIRKAKIDGGTIVDIEFQAHFQLNDRLILVSARGGQQYFVLDKAVV